MPGQELISVCIQWAHWYHVEPTTPLRHSLADQKTPSWVHAWLGLSTLAGALSIPCIVCTRTMGLSVPLRFERGASYSSVQGQPSGIKGPVGDCCCWLHFPGNKERGPDTSHLLSWEIMSPAHNLAWRFSIVVDWLQGLLGKRGYQREYNYMESVSDGTSTSLEWGLLGRVLAWHKCNLWQISERDSHQYFTFIRGREETGYMIWQLKVLARYEEECSLWCSQRQSARYLMMMHTRAHTCTSTHPPTHKYTKEVFINNTIICLL